MSLTIKRLGHQGHGIADGPDGDIYVPFTLPGEVVEGEISNAHIAAPRILTPSENRVKAPCRHFKSCGGCALQHASDAFLADWKVEIVRSALTAQNLSTDIRPIKTSPESSRRRAAFSGRRTKKSAMVGFHAKGSDVLIEIPDCTLLHPDILAAIPVYEELTRLGASRKNTIQIAVTQSATGLDVAVTGVKAADGPLLVQLGGFAEVHKLARISWNDEVIATRTAPVQQFGLAKITPPPGAFLQATEAGQAALTAAVQKIIGPAKRVVDLFAGCGTFTLPLAETAEMHAVESADDHLQALAAAARNTPNLRTVTTETRDLFRRPLLSGELNKFDAAIIDPPRAGAKAQISELIASKVSKIAYVSCNPITFARDAALLIEAGFDLNWIEVIDQFRWSPHTELVASFTRA